MSTAVFSHTVFGQHETPPGHAEQPDRYGRVEAALQHPDFDGLIRKQAPIADWTAPALAHGHDHIRQIQTLRPPVDLIALDPDTFAGPHTVEAALRGVGGAMAAVDAVASGDVDNAFVAARPPGHHAVVDGAMGFCVFNNAAIAALHARHAHGKRKIAVVDFDVHHGNGTQDILEADADAFFASTHEWPQYPGTGASGDRGDYGQCHNVPLATGEGGQTFRRVWGTHLLPALHDFDPDFIVVSAGFDAHAADPLGGLMLTEDDFRWITAELLAIARDRTGGGLVSVMEGGYDLEALGASVGAHVATLEEGRV